MDPINQHTGSTSGASTSRRQGVDRAVELNHINDHNNNSDDFSHRSGLNCARDFHERQQTPRLLLPTPIICHYCRAKLFHGETRNFCCNGGKIVLPEIPVPSELYNLYTDQSAEGRIFRQNICAFNHMFSFTSLGAKLDESVVGRQGVYAFRAHGTMYHKIGTLLPSPGTRPRYIQMLIYDTKHEIENRLLENNGLDRGFVDKIKHILDAHNPFVQTLRQLAQRDDILDCKLLIKERPTAHSRYALPTASQVAAIVVGGDEVVDTTNRDIIVQTIGGQLMNVKEFSGYYDPLQYPLLLPYGTYGWDSDCRTVDGTRVTCCDYYAYMLQIETQKLRFIRPHQKDIRAELYQGLQDCLNAGEDDAGNVGWRTILPSSFVGSPRDMYQRYQDAMSVVQKFVNNLHYPTFKQAAEKVFLEEDDSIRQCLIETRAVRMPSALRSILLQHKRILKEFDLPQIAEDYQDLRNISSLIEDELSITIPLDDLNAVSKLNPDQLQAFNTIKHAIMRKQNQTFFVDGPGGTGKTFLYRALLATFRNVGFIMVATATSGIAAI
ncbi:UNVERIFIED_CONTAM: hypothetical protein Sradi_5068000 [Sesamum radiatum]|uniref:ATP-dependent DNA helicase n=1 Tax=Sesamum radiatum TaxID=300843 RepID=A0AAW2M3R4_SESRA